MDLNIDNLLIHIGYHKTATTWLQKKLFIAGNEVFEPLSKKNNGHSSLAKHFIYDDEKYLLSPFENNESRIQEELEIIISRKDKLKSKIPVMSHERLSGNPHSSGFDAKKIASMLKHTFPEAKILVVIREQKSFILSNYFEYLSIGGTNNLDKYLNTKYDGKRPFFSPAHIKYLPLITEYYNLYGKENVLVLPYEMFKSEPQLFIDKLGGILNLQISMHEDAFNKKIHMRGKAISYYMRTLNLFRRSSSVNNYSSLSSDFTRKAVIAISIILSKILPSWVESALKDRLKLKISNWVGDRYVASNKELSKLIDINLSQYGYH
ncbi:MAG: sulfotransferase domain-containing protein [Lentisphaeria bacterium]|nr:sulfotransferase domain-containing protein [Lentisphaeria bacterium]